MNYPIDIEIWKKLVRSHAHSIQEMNEYPRSDGICLVLNIDEDHDETFGSGPVCMAFARYNYEAEKFMSVIFPEKEISYYDFRDICNHNVGGNSGKITHWLDDYDLSCLIMDLLVSMKDKK